MGQLCETTSLPGMDFCNAGMKRCVVPWSDSIQSEPPVKVPKLIDRLNEFALLAESRCGDVRMLCATQRVFHVSPGNKCCRNVFNCLQTSGSTTDTAESADRLLT